MAVAAFVTLGFGLMASPATATDGNAGSIDTSISTATTNPGAFTDKGKGGDDDRCKPGNVCKKINWCGYGDQNPKSDKLTADAPMVFTGNKGGDEPPCIKKPKIDYKCCVVTDKGTVQNFTVKNRAEYPFKVKFQFGDSKPVVRWVGAGETVEFRFTGVVNGEHKLVAAVWAGGKTWCVFKTETIRVKCPTPTPSTSSPTPTPSTSTPPASESPSPEPSASASTTPAPGGGGSDNEPQLPVTGASLGGVVTAGVLLLVAGIGALFMRRRRQVRFTA